MSEIPFDLTTEFIELYKLLKVCGLTESGGMAKQAISESAVKVNGETETRKGFKVRPGMQIEYAGSIIKVQ